MTFLQIRVRTITFLFEDFTTISQKLSPHWEQDLGRYLEGQGHSMTLQQNRIRPITLLFEVWFYNYYRNDHHIETTFGSIPRRSRSQHDLAAKKSCPAHNIFIWSRILQLFYRNDHHIEMRCRAQHFGPYQKGQGHGITLQQNRVQPITSLFEVPF